MYEVVSIGLNLRCQEGRVVTWRARGELLRFMGLASPSKLVQAIISQPFCFLNVHSGKPSPSYVDLLCQDWQKDLYEQGPCWQTIENIHWKITLHHKSVTSKTFSHARHHSQAQGTRSRTSLRKHYFASHKNQRAHYNLLTLFWTWIHMVTSLLAIIVIATT